MAWIALDWLIYLVTIHSFIPSFLPSFSQWVSHLFCFFGGSISSVSSVCHPQNSENQGFESGKWVINVWTSPRTAGIWSPWYERCTRPLARFWWHRVRVECKGNRCYTGVAKVDHGTQTHQPRGRLETFRVAWQVKLDWLGWLDFGNLGDHVIHSWGYRFMMFHPLFCCTTFGPRWFKTKWAAWQKLFHGWQGKQNEYRTKMQKKAAEKAFLG